MVERGNHEWSQADKQGITYCPLFLIKKDVEKNVMK